jgi:hypothetical protein
MPTFRQKALGYYRDQDIRIIVADCREGSIQPYLVEALVRGHEATYRLTLQDGVWRCTCDVAKPDCAHRAAVQMCTGHHSSAAREMAQ